MGGHSDGGDRLRSQAFDRKVPRLKKQLSAPPPTVNNREHELLRQLEREANQLHSVFRVATSEFERRLLQRQKRRDKAVATSSSGLTPPQAAKRLGVSPDKIRAWIASGELVATNVAANGSSRPRWRIAEQDLVAFERRRQPEKPVPAKRKSRKAEGGVKEYF